MIGAQIGIQRIVIGIIVGFAVAWFLVLPARIQTEKATINEELRKVSEQLDVKTATINELESKVKTLIFRCFVKNSKTKACNFGQFTMELLEK